MHAPAARSPAAGWRRLPSRCVHSRAVSAPVVETKPTPAWTPDSWRAKQALQMPEYSDKPALEAALTELRRCPPLIFAGEVRT